VATIQCCRKSKTQKNAIWDDGGVGGIFIAAWASFEPRGMAKQI